MSESKEGGTDRGQLGMKVTVCVTEHDCCGPGKQQLLLPLVL